MTARLRRNSPTLAALGRQLRAQGDQLFWIEQRLRTWEKAQEERDEALKGILNSTLTALQTMTETIGAMQDKLESRLPVWGDPADERAKKPGSKPS